MYAVSDNIRKKCEHGRKERRRSSISIHFLGKSQVWLCCERLAHGDLLQSPVIFLLFIRYANFPLSQRPDFKGFAGQKFWPGDSEPPLVRLRSHVQVTLIRRSFCNECWRRAVDNSRVVSLKPRWNRGSKTKTEQCIRPIRSIGRTDDE